MRRREFFGAAALVTLAAGARRAAGQEETRNTSGAPMDQQAYKPVRLPPKEGATTKLTDAQRDDLEHHLHCQCGCGLDIYTCRTTDFSCTVSPAMHLDVLGLVSGGYGVDEIMRAFRQVYGEGVLMSPVKEGFNWVGYLAPFGALAAGAVVAGTLIRKWSRSSPTVAATVPSTIDATPDELARLRAALKDDA